MKSLIQTIVKSFFLLSFFFSLSSVFAQAPEKMSYQAVIRNASNTLITNQAVGMRVSILQGSSTGTAVYSELFNPNPQTNINGLVTVEIGSGLPITGTFAGINWANGPFFIRTETDPTGGTTYSIVGTSQLLSAPYALFAKTSGDTGWGLLGNNINAGNYIGTTNDQDVTFRRSGEVSGKIASNNTSYGFRSLLNVTTGNLNCAIGKGALQLNTIGRGNTAIGYEAMQFNTVGDFNISIGSFALSKNTTGSDNSAIGSSALFFNTTGTGNTANGASALRSNTIGNSNTAVGNRAMDSNSTGSNNTSIGAFSLIDNTTGTNNSALGSNALSNNLTGTNNTAVGFSALNGITTGNSNTAIGRSSLINISTGDNNIGIGQNAIVPSGTGSNQIRIGNTAITYAGIQVAWSVTSDKRWKENIQPSNIGLNFIKDLKPVSYNRKNDANKKVEYGIIAQELETSLQKHGANTNGIITKDDEGMYSVRYNDLLAPMIKAIQEQQVMIEKLEAKIKKLENK